MAYKSHPVHELLTKEKLLEHLRQGLNQLQIAEIYGCHRTTIREILRNYKVDYKQIRVIS